MEERRSLNDTALFVWINGLPHTPWLDRSALFLTDIQQKEALVILAGFFVYGLLFKKPLVWQSALVLAVAFPLTSDIVDSLKLEFNRARPYDLLQNVHVVGSRPSSSSFPASAAALAALLFSYVWYWTRRRFALWASLVAFLGFLRVYEGLHYPSDVFGGWVLGAGMAWLTYLLHRKVINYLTKKRSRP